MTNLNDSDNSLLRALRELSARQKLPTALVEHLSLYFADADVASIDEGRAEELHGAAVQHQRLGQTRQSGQALVALYTPDFDRHGWHSAHTVIDIVTDDMPFLVDSVTMLIYQQGFAIHRLMHPLLGIERDAAGALARSAARGTAGTHTESWIHLEIDRISDPAQIDALRAELMNVLADVRAAVEDHAAMRQSVELAIKDVERVPDPEDREVIDFLRWVAAENFVFLGYTYYSADPATQSLKRSPDGGLGLLRRDDHPRFGGCLNGIPGDLNEIARTPSALSLVKADVRSSLHRPKYLDFIGVLDRDMSGKIRGEHVFVGLYAMHVYHISTTEIPVVRQKVAAVRQACGFAPGSHKDKTLINVLETYPRDELIEITVDDLYRIASGIVTLSEHPRVRVLLRNDSWGRYVSALVYMPRDRFDTSVRRRIIALLNETFKAESTEFYLMVGDSRLARLHLIARMKSATLPAYDAAVLEHEVARIVRGWQDELQQHLVETYGEARGNALLRRYADLLPLAYQDQVVPTSAVSDLERLEAAEKSGQVEIKLCAPYGDDKSDQHIKLFLNGQPRPLSAVLPVFENLGVTVLSEQPFRLSGGDLHIADFAVRLPNIDALNDETTRQAFVQLLEQLLRDEAENDGFNRLALQAGLTGARINVLRAYGRYLRQAGLPFSQVYIERCLAAHPRIARLLADLFDARFAPFDTGRQESAIEAELAAALTKVSNLDDDRILSGYRTVLDATVRTNAWQTGADGRPKDYLSLKISSRKIPFLPKPVPLYEIFVYSQRVEGLHLRGSSVSRGGLRWSDRMEDYRTECVALVKAQMVKNVVTVPLGAKGCFVGKRLPSPADRDAYLAEGVACYQTYIRGLLDITDNLVNGTVIPPANVRRRDGDDPYLVVAADKGTATFSDIANAIAIEYGFWLGDAFASGGSVGYDHKKMGITARGAWEAVKRHFRELGIDTQTQAFTAVGIGDMSGDVFGNGMLRSNTMRLVAAFDHRHIFLDPNPDAEKSFIERQRLFDLPRSSWDDYDRSLISAGGGVWPRSAKSIPLSPEAQAVLGVSADQLSPAELISAILRAPVDLLYNGGIGTYFKASSQSHQDANDRSNDAIRIDATELRAKVIGEGGNLGFTQKARIEYALGGGHLYTDAIDNSAGVDTSDHEVNLKILTSTLIAEGDMTFKQRDALLSSITDEVARLVLIDNYQQTAAVSLEAAGGAALLNAHAQLIRHLESKGLLNRTIEFLPDEKQLLERAQTGRGLTTPEISVLLAYMKIALKESILASKLPDAQEFQPLFMAYFPAAVIGQCSQQLASHPLRREITTTQIVSHLVNRMGTGFILQTGDETGADLEQIIKAWYSATELLHAERLWEETEGLDLKVSWDQQMSLMNRLRDMVSLATRQILASEMASGTISAIIQTYQPAVEQAFSGLRAGKSDALEALTTVLDARGRIASLFEQVDLARASGKPLEEVAATCNRMDAGIDLPWMEQSIARLPANNRWQARARAQLSGDLRKLRQFLLQKYAGESQPALADACSVVEELKHNAPQDLAMLTAGMAEIRRLLTAA